MSGSEFGLIHTPEYPKRIRSFDVSGLMSIKTHSTTSDNIWGWHIYHTAVLLDQNRAFEITGVPTELKSAGTLILMNKDNDERDTQERFLRFIPDSTKVYLKKTTPALLRETQMCIGTLFPHLKGTLRLEGSVQIHAFTYKGFDATPDGRVTPHTSDFDMSYLVSPKHEGGVFHFFSEAKRLHQFSHLKRSFSSQYPTMNRLLREGRLSITVGQMDFPPLCHAEFNLDQASFKGFGLL